MCPTFFQFPPLCMVTCIWCGNQVLLLQLLDVASHCCCISTIILHCWCLYILLLFAATYVMLQPTTDVVEAAVAAASAADIHSNL